MQYEHVPHGLLTLVLAVGLSACSAGNGLTPRSTDDGGSGFDAGPLPPRSDAGPPGAEVCDNGLDDDADGQVEEDCNCSSGLTQSCFPGSPAQAGVGVCSFGLQRCIGDDEFASWGSCDGAGAPGAEVCGNGIDEDCSGADLPCDLPEADAGAGADAGSPGPDAGGPGPDGGPTIVEVDIFLFGDCLTASCPSEAPYPIGCMVFFTPGDHRGCVASRPDSSTVYFQAGDECDAGFVTGTLLCSSEMGAPLNNMTCPINKPTPIHVRDSGDCPEISD